METRPVGTSGLRVSRLGLGTLTWGRDTDADQARGLLETFHDGGGTLIDTAAAYGAGDAERLIGALMGELGIRDDLVIATKAGFVIRHGERIVDTSRRALLRDLEGSLRRLNTDHVDLWQLHAWGDVPLEESLAAIDQAVSSGMACYAGVSNYVGWQTAQAATWQRAYPGRAPIVSAQVEYSLLARRAEVEVLPAVKAFGMGFFPWSPLGRGVLTGQYRSGTPRGSRAATDHFAWFVEPYLREPQPRGGRGGGPGGRRPGPHAAAGGFALGPRRPRGDRSPARSPHGGATGSGAGHGGAGSAGRDRFGSR